MQKDVVLDPGVRPVEVEAIVVTAYKDVINEVDDRVGAVTAGEVDDIIVIHRLAPKVADEKAMTVEPHAAGPVARLEPRRSWGEITITNDE